jgi:rubrerythrin
MGMGFNADNVFEIAEQIERNGIRFYRRAADSAAGRETQQLLLDLAQMEVEHEKTFQAMRRELSEAERTQAVFDPENEMTAYLRSFADGRVFDLRRDVSELLTGQESLEEILHTALGREKDAIVFFLGAKEMVRGDLGKEKIDRIIKEEMGHVSLLSRELTARAG